MALTRYGSPGRAQSNLKNMFNRITAFHMSLVQVSRQNTEETETEMFWKDEAPLLMLLMLCCPWYFWVKFLSNVKNLIFNKSLRVFELMVEWIDKRWTSIEFESQTFLPDGLCTKVCLSWPGTIRVRQEDFFWKLWLKNINRLLGRSRKHIQIHNTHLEESPLPKLILTLSKVKKVAQIACRGRTSPAQINFNTFDFEGINKSEKVA